MESNINDIEEMRLKKAMDVNQKTEQTTGFQGNLNHNANQRVRYIDHLMTEQKRAHHNISILDKLVQLIENSDDVKLFIELSEQLGNRL